MNLKYNNPQLYYAWNNSLIRDHYYQKIIYSFYHIIYKKLIFKLKKISHNHIKYFQ